MSETGLDHIDDKATSKDDRLLKFVVENNRIYRYDRAGMTRVSNPRVQDVPENSSARIHWSEMETFAYISKYCHKHNYDIVSYQYVESKDREIYLLSRMS